MQRKKTVKIEKKTLTASRGSVKSNNNNENGEDQ